MKKINKSPQREEIWMIKCDKIKEFSKPYRPVLIMSKNIQNEFDEMVVVVPLTTEDIENVKLWEVFVDNTPETGLEEPSKIIVNRPYAVFKELRLIKRLGEISKETMDKVKVA